MARTSTLAAFAVAVAVATGTIGQTPRTAGAQSTDYLVYVASEAADTIGIVRFDARGGRLDRELPTGIMPVDIDGPHGLTMSPDGRYYYVSLAHGQPFGSVWKYSTKDDSVVGRVTLAMFPASMQTTPNGEFLYVVNFNLHGDMVPSSVSVVATDAMVEVARITTCTMPHGSRINPQGTKHYSACMMDDTVVEIDTSTLKVSRHFVVTKGSESGRAGSPPHHGPAATAHQMTGCSPTWVQPSVDGRSLFVACNASDEIVEIDATAWTLTRRIQARPGVYYLAATRNRLVATNKRDQSVSVIDTRDGRELARIPTKRSVVHGVVVSPDERYAFVSVEGMGAEPGTVEMIDLRTPETVATVDVAPQAGGIDLLTAKEDATGRQSHSGDDFGGDSRVIQIPVLTSEK